MPLELLLNKPGIHKIAFHRVGKCDAEIEFILDKYQKVNVFKLNKFQDRPNRIVVDITIEETSPQIKTKLPEARKKKIIVIDPGHGGEDPGAVGKRGTYEKNIVLQISREIQKKINEMPGFGAVLTRDGDYYVSFNKRLKKARDLDASLFISIHADAARNRSAKGSSVYALSTGGASNEAAKLLANNENLSDIFGGVADSDVNHASNPIIMNMFQTNTINLSKIYADVLLKHLVHINSIKYESVQEAPFRVLKLPDIPAVLIETAYISNRKEELLLKQKSFQQNIAAAIASSIKDYFSVTGKDDDRDTIFTTGYTIKKGDTLYSLARTFNTKVEVILELNNLKLNDTLFIGREIIVPAKEETIIKEKKRIPDRTKSRKQPSRYYTVKKGDTLFIIANKNSTTVAELLKINNMKLTDKLLYGKKIKLP
jgi:N-acetylmuramoyl-L-alanine amidase